MFKIVDNGVCRHRLLATQTAHPVSLVLQNIFEQLGLEPWGRIGLGVAELIIAILILVPRTTWLGALLGIGIMAGAIFSHVTQLGVVVQNDGGTLFILALVTLIFCMVLAWVNRKQIPYVNK